MIIANFSQYSRRTRTTTTKKILRTLAQMPRSKDKVSLKPVQTIPLTISMLVIKSNFTLHSRVKNYTKTLHYCRRNRMQPYKTYFIMHQSIWRRKVGFQKARDRRGKYLSHLFHVALSFKHFIYVPKYSSNKIRKTQNE